MGRVKLQIKKIENITNRQVTFSKRRNGLIKKAYELSILCDVDLALIMFSPSARLTAFSSKNSVEDVIERYLRLPQNERGGLHNQEVLEKVVGRAKGREGNHLILPQSNPAGFVDSQIEVVKHEIMRCKSIMEEMDQRLRIYEGEVTTLCEAQHQECLLMQALDRVRIRKKILESSCENGHQAVPQAEYWCPESGNISNLIAAVGNPMMLDYGLPPQGEAQQFQILNFMASNIIFHPRDEAQREQNQDDGWRKRSPGSGADGATASNHLGLLSPPPDVSLSPGPATWPTSDHFYPGGNSGSFSAPQAAVRTDQFTPHLD